MVHRYSYFFVFYHFLRISRLQVLKTLISETFIQQAYLWKLKTIIQLAYRLTKRYYNIIFVIIANIIQYKETKHTFSKQIF